MLARSRVVVATAPTFADALDGADIVCATTHSPEPVVRREWLRAGMHVNSVGFNTAGREVDAQTVLDALVVVESRSSALAPIPAGANELLWPIRDGLIDAGTRARRARRDRRGHATRRRTPEADHALQVGRRRGRGPRRGDARRARRARAGVGTTIDL